MPKHPTHKPSAWTLLTNWLLLLCLLSSFEYFVIRDEKVLDATVPSGETGSNSLFLQLVSTFVDEAEQIGDPVFVNFEGVNSSDTPVSNCLKAGDQNGDNKFFIGPTRDASSLKAKDCITPLSDWVENIYPGGLDSFLNLLDTRALEHCMVDGELYTIPIYRTNLLVLYNLDVLSSIFGRELMEEDIPTDFTELTDLIGYLQERRTGKVMDIGGERYDWVYEHMVEQAGGNILNSNGRPVLNSPAGMDVANALSELFRTDGVNITNSWRGCLNRFTQQESPIIITSSSAFDFLQQKSDFEWIARPLPGISSMPARASFANKGTADVYGVYLSKGMSWEMKEDALRLIEFLLIPENQDKLTGHGYLSVASGAVEHYQKMEMHPMLDIALDELETATGGFSVAEQQDLRACIRKMIDDLHAGKAVSSTVRLYQEKAERIVE